MEISELLKEKTPLLIHENEFGKTFSYANINEKYGVANRVCLYTEDDAYVVMGVGMKLSDSENPLIRIDLVIFKEKGIIRRRINE